MAFFSSNTSLNSFNLIIVFSEKRDSSFISEQIKLINSKESVLEGLLGLIFISKKYNWLYLYNVLSKFKGRLEFFSILQKSNNSSIE